MTRVFLTSAAEAELAAAVDWYDAHAPGTGAKVLDEYEALIDRLSINPRQFPLVHGDVRRAGFSHFPYGLFFRLNHDRVEVFACFHARRDPTLWRTRS